MGEKTGIAWTDHTFNPWWGCTKVSPACANCYAETLSRRFGKDLWGPRAQRRFFGDKHWAEPRKWNAAAERDGIRRRVFCASMADVFERHADPAVQADLDAARERLWALIEATPALDWLLLTKRPENILGMVPRLWLLGCPRNVWLGVTVEDRKRAAERLPWLACAGVALNCAVTFVSHEPALEYVNFMGIDMLPPDATSGATRARYDALDGWSTGQSPMPRPVDWVIIGGESGAKARPFEIGWVSLLLSDCDATGTACFVKQLGSNPVNNGARLRLKDRQGADLSEWPAWAWVREFPLVVGPASGCCDE